MMLKIGVYIDAANIFHCIRNKYNMRLNYSKYMEYVKELGDVTNATVFGAFNEKEAEGFIFALHKLGYNTDFKPLKRVADSRKGNQDVSMAVKIVEQAADVDMIILGTADGDFKPLIEHLKKLGKRVWVIASGISYELEEVADKCIEIPKSFMQAK